MICAKLKLKIYFAGINRRTRSPCKRQESALKVELLKNALGD
jgi:hypothetical protein